MPVAPCLRRVTFSASCVASGLRVSSRAIFTSISWQLLLLAPRTSLSLKGRWTRSCMSCAACSLCLRALPLLTFCPTLTLRSSLSLWMGSHWVSPPRSCEQDPPVPLSHCTFAWKLALDDPATVDSLLQDELSEGWVRLVPGGLPQLQSQYVHSAVGKLGLVKAHGRPPRLVVDSSVSGVTANTVLPNRSANPTLCSLRHCLPTGLSKVRLSALVLDVSKAHCRIKIAPPDQGMLCFHHRGQLYQCLTLNFGARASGFIGPAWLAFSRV